MRRQIDQHEAEIRIQIAPYLDEYRVLVARLGNAIGTALDRTLEVESLSLAGMIQMLQLARLQGDLRVLDWMVQHGYAMAAASHTATVYELAFRTLFLGDSTDRADAWMAHEKTSKSYPESLRDAINDFFGRLPNILPSTPARVYDVYSELCWAKHGNPVLQRHYGTTVEGDQSVVQQVPYVDQKTIWICRHAVIHAVRVLRWLVLWFYQWHLSEAATVSAQGELAFIVNELDRLGSRDNILHDPAE